MASPIFSDININLASPDTAPSNPPTYHPINSLFDSFVVDESPIQDTVAPISSENVEPSPDAPVGVFNETDFQTPVPISQHETDVQTPVPISQQPPSSDPETGSSSKRGRKRGGGGASVAGVFLDPEQFPDWVPRDWKVMKRARHDGSSVDTYYYDPVTNRQLRSKREVLEFLANGSCTRNHRRINYKEGSTKTLPWNNSQPINFSSATTPEKLKSPQPINSEAIPRKVRRVHGNSAGWTPFIGEEMVPKQIRLEWQAWFNSLAPKNSGCRA